MTAPLTALPSARRELLGAVKRLGEATAEDLAQALGMTPSGARQQLAAAEADGLVDHRTSASGRGRPRKVYGLTAQGHDLFPAGYSMLANDVLDTLDELDPALVEAVFDRRRRQRLERARLRLAGLDAGAQVQELARILEEDGYLADASLDDDGTWWITERHCAIFAVARRYGQACSTELAFLRQALPGADIERVSHMASGQSRCAYRVRLPAS